MQTAKRWTLLPLPLLFWGCAPKSPYDVSAAEVQRRKSPPMEARFTPGAETQEKRFKKGDTLPDGTVAKEDLIMETQDKLFKKGDKLPDGKVADGDRHLRTVRVRPGH